MRAKKKYGELRSKIKDLIRSMTKNSDDHNEKYMKIKLNSDEELPLNKIIEFLACQYLLEQFFMKIINFIFFF